MAVRHDRHEGLARLGRWVAGVVVGLVGVAFFLTVFLVPKHDALPLAEACLAAIGDGEVSPGEMAAISAQASALCLRGGGSPRR